MKTIVTDKTGFPIQPSDIDATKHFFDAFGHTETEISAGWLVRLAQEHGSWKPFKIEEIKQFYNEGSCRYFWFNRLIESESVRSRPGADPMQKGGGWIVREGELYFFTVDFIQRCYKSSPATAKASV